MAIQIRFVTQLVGFLCLVLVLGSILFLQAWESEKARLSTVRVVEACRKTLVVNSSCSNWPQVTERDDAWGHPLRCVVDPEGISRVVSLGRDGVPGGTGVDGEIACFPSNGSCMCHFGPEKVAP
jgi:hypothetical protein